MEFTLASTFAYGCILVSENTLIFCLEIVSLQVSDRGKFQVKKGVYVNKCIQFVFVIKLIFAKWIK